MEKGAKSKKEAKDDKPKDQKLEEQLLNELSGNGFEEKLKLLLTKHIESERNNKKLKQELKEQLRVKENLQREKENLQREYNKGVLMRDKLQEVCREQQKIIKSIKNESLAKLREEEERRKESQIKFQASLNEINQSLSKNNEENLKLRDHNIEMTKKLKFLAEQYQTREQQLEKLNEQVQLETQLQQAKFSKIQLEAAMEKEILIKEKQIALERLCQTQKVIKELTEREQALKEQLHLYTSKYDDFQNSLQKSNDIFASYKVELEKMSKNTKKLEKESNEWKNKYERSNATLIGLATEKQERDEHAARCTKQVDQLQKLLRALQLERTHLYKVLRDNNIEVPALPTLPEEPEPMKPSTSKEQEDKQKMEMMTKNCAEIKQTLASLQSQIKTLKSKEAEACSLAKMENTLTQQQQQEDALKRQNNKKKKQKSKNNKNKETTPQPTTTKISSTTTPQSTQVVAAQPEAEKAEPATAENFATEANSIETPAENESAAAAVETEAAAAVVAVNGDDKIDKNCSAETTEMLSNGENSQPTTPESVKVAKLLADAMTESPPSPASVEEPAEALENHATQPN